MGFLLAFFMLFSACMKHPTGLPEPLGYGGLLALGWNSVISAQFLEGLDYFLQAMEVDITRPEAFLGAGIASIHLNGYHGSASSYFQTAIQLDQGQSAVVRHVNQVLVQDTLWTSVQCIDPDLPSDSLSIWLSFTADSGLVWIGNQIMNYLEENDLSTDLTFRLMPGPGLLGGCVDLYNMQNGQVYGADSISGNYVYFTVPMTRTSQGPGNYYCQWVMADQGILYDYAELLMGESPSQITLDAMAGRVSLEQARGSEGDLLQAAACTQGLIWNAPDYRFGKGDTLLESVYDTHLRQVVSCCGSIAFSRGRYEYCWFLCRQAGYGLELDPDSDSFLLELLQVLQEMGEP